MKYLSLTLALLAAFLYLDHRYNAELSRAYEFNRWVIQNYCRPNGLK